MLEGNKMNSSSLEVICHKYRDIRCSAIAENLESLIRQAESNEISYLRFATLLVEEEGKVRERKRIEMNRKRGKFPVIKRLDEFDYQFQTTINKKQIASLLDFSFIDNRENLIFIGPPGVGKTHLAIALGLQAIDTGYKTVFHTAMELIEELDLAEVQGKLKQKINALLKFDVIIIDELGYLPMNKQGIFNLFQLINAFYEYRSIILTTNKDFTNWNDFFFDDNVAIPVIDRLIHHARIFMLGGESYRLKSKMAPK